MQQAFLSLLFSFCIFSISAQTTGNSEKFEIRQGSVLTYEVNSGGTEYDFIVKIKSYNKNPPKGTNPVVVELDWEMTAPINKKGTIKITKEGMNYGRSWHNFFTSGTTTLSYKETSVLISHMISLELYLSSPGDTIDDLKINGIDSDAESLTLQYTYEYDYSLNGKNSKIEVLKLTNDDETKWVDISITGQLAFIVAMDIGFEIKLKSIKQ